MVHVIEQENPIISGPNTVGELIDMLQSLPTGIYEIQLTVISQSPSSANENKRQKRRFRFRV